MGRKTVDRDDNPFQMAAMGITMGGCKPGEGVGVAVEMSQRAASGKIPDKDGSREALELWGMEILEGGGRITQMVGGCNTLSVVLPEGWEAKSTSNGHNGLFDDKGIQRIWWYIHGWEPVDVRIGQRYSVRLKELGPKHGTVQVLDAKGSIQAFPVEYPHSRDNINHYEHYTSYYLELPDDMPMPTRQAMDRANNAVRRDAEAEARKWLTENRPGWDQRNDHGPARSWLIEGPTVDCGAQSETDARSAEQETP